MANELEDYYRELQQDIYSAADADHQLLLDTFFDRVSEFIIESGELDAADRCPYDPPKGGLRVDGYGGDPIGTGGILSLIVADYSQNEEVTTLTTADMKSAFKRVSNFVIKSLDSTFRNSLEETTPGFGLADLIVTRWPMIQKIKLILISNKRLSSRAGGLKDADILGIPVTHTLWDIGRIFRFATSGRGREDIEIDLVSEFGGPLQALPAHLKHASYKAYLAVLPGKQLAAIYDRWGARLLEQNVRVFLQARGNVNKGIRTTIEADPEMFFAYNNGITATAQNISSEIVDGRLMITGLTNLQIVNGGQTTASIHSASKRPGIDMSNVFVQMKLSIIDPSKSEEVVPKISEYANSQNRVNAADFFSNHPYHIRMADFSRRTFAPSPDGTFRESKWFYERARGQYQDAQSGLTPGQRKKFELDFPKNQMLTKTELAKYLNTWAQFPHVVCKGSQKNFAHFAAVIGKEWVKMSDVFNEAYFRNAIVKAIIFREVERIVSKRPWYEGAYRSNFVPYTIAKFAYDVESGTSSFDFEAVWRAQAVSGKLREALTTVADAIKDVILNPPPGKHNVMEWAKAEACWTRASETRIDWSQELLLSLRAVETQRDIQAAAIREQKILNGIEAQVAVVNAGGQLWRNIKEWGSTRNLISETEASILDVAASIPGRIPSEPQSAVLLRTLGKLQQNGCRLGLSILEHQH